MPHRKRPLKVLTERELLTLESEIGSRLFGPIPDGHRREFFCPMITLGSGMKNGSDSKKKLERSTVRYEISDQGVLKVQEGASATAISQEEPENFYVAVRMYYEQVARHVYHRDPTTGQNWYNKTMAMIYLDYAAATPLDDRVLAAMQPFFADQFFNPSSPYAPAVLVRRAYEAAKDLIAQAIG